MVEWKKQLHEAVQHGNSTYCKDLKGCGKFVCTESIEMQPGTEA